MDTNSPFKKIDFSTLNEKPLILFEAMGKLRGLEITIYKESTKTTGSINSSKNLPSEFPTNSFIEKCLNCETIVETIHEGSGFSSGFEGYSEGLTLKCNNCFICYKYSSSSF